VRTFISGQVIREANDQPIPGATIQTEPPTEQVLTNQAGNFSIEAEIEVGKVYRIKANKDGFVPNNTVVEAQEGKTTSADIVLKKQGPKLAAEPTSLTFGMRRSGDSVLIKNIGADTLRYQAQDPPVDCQPSSVPDGGGDKRDPLQSSRFPSQHKRRLTGHG
jgi:hypothetical protein